MSTPQAQARGFLATLFDFSFSSYVTPKLIRAIYVFVVVVSALAALVFVLGAFATNVFLGLVTLVILAPLLFLFYVVVYRVFLEVVMAVFTIAENTTRLVGGIAGGTAPPGAFGGLAGGSAPGTTRRVEPWSAPEPGWSTAEPTAPTAPVIPDDPVGGTPEG